MLETGLQFRAIQSQTCLLLKEVSEAVLQLSFQKTILNPYLRVQTTSKQLTT